MNTLSSEANPFRLFDYHNGKRCIKVWEGKVQLATRTAGFLMILTGAGKGKITTTPPIAVLGNSCVRSRNPGFIPAIHDETVKRHISLAP